MVSFVEYMLKASWEEVQYSEGVDADEFFNQLDRQG